MSFSIWIVIGGVIGWLASMAMKTDAQQGIFLTIVVGIVGAGLDGRLLAPLFGTGTINSDNFSLSSLLGSFLDAVILLGIVNLLRRGRLRYIPISLTQAGSSSVPAFLLPPRKLSGQYHSNDREKCVLAGYDCPGKRHNHCPFDSNISCTMRKMSLTSHDSVGILYLAR